MPLEIREIVIKAQLESGRGDHLQRREDLTPEFVETIRAICQEEWLARQRRVARPHTEKFDR